MSKKKTFFIVVILVLIFNPISLLIMFASVKEYNLNVIQVKNNTKALDSLVIISGRHEKSSATPNGDALTGSTAPATVIYKLGDTISNTHNDVRKNLERQGYKFSDTFRGDGYYSTPEAGSGSNTFVSHVSIDASNDKAVLSITYKLAENYVCTDVCGNFIVKQANLTNQKASELTVTYDPSATFVEKPFANLGN